MVGKKRVKKAPQTGHWIKTVKTAVVKTGRKATDVKTKTVYKNSITNELRVKKLVIRNGVKKMMYVAF